MLSLEQASQIDHIVLKLNRAVSQIDIVNWLDNFDKSEWGLALEVLEHLDYFSENEIISHYEEKLVEICKEIEDYHKKVRNYIVNYRPSNVIEKSKRKHFKRKLRLGFNKPVIHPVGKYGKSGTAMIYYAIHVPSFKTLKLDLLKNFSQFNPKNEHFPAHIILLDDFIGTGRSVTGYINDVIFEKE